jgi:hypothetical protein
VVAIICADFLTTGAIDAPTFERLATSCRLISDAAGVCLSAEQLIGGVKLAGPHGVLELKH